MRSISTDFPDPAAKPDDEPSPAFSGGALRNAYRPRPSTVERSREIREIAARYIAGHGLWCFSMLSLAKHLNCLLPTLCYYYKKREELITDIVLRHVETLRARIGQAIDDLKDDNPSASVHAFAREYLLVGLAEQDFHRLVIFYAGLAGPHEGATFLARHDALRRMVETRLVAHAPKLADQPETARALSRALLDILSGAATSLEPYGTVKPAAFAAMAADFVLDQAKRV